MEPAEPRIRDVNQACQIAVDHIADAESVLWQAMDENELPDQQRQLEALLEELWELQSQLENTTEQN